MKGVTLGGYRKSNVNVRTEEEYQMFYVAVDGEQIDWSRRR